MMTERFRTAVDSAAQLPPATQDQLAAALEEAIKQVTRPVPQMSPDVRRAFEQAMREHEATLEYLKDK